MPFAPINALDDLLTDPQVAALGMLQAVPGWTSRPSACRSRSTASAGHAHARAGIGSAFTIPKMMCLRRKTLREP